MTPQEIKEKLTLEDIFNLLSEWGGNPNYAGTGLIADTICHNHPHEGSHKLYYYEDSHLFKCYTHCDTFDIFSLVQKVHEMQNNEQLSFHAAKRYIEYRFFAEQGFDMEITQEEENELYRAIDDIHDFSLPRFPKLKVFPDFLIKNMKTFRIDGWEKEGIHYKTLQKYKIRYYPPNAEIIIPHFSEDGDLVGIRSRVLDPEAAERFGKYHPLWAGGIMYNHPLGYNLYGLNFNRVNIAATKVAILFEGEKSVMQLEEILDRNIGVAVCGSNITDAQIYELLDLGVNEIVIAFDRQYQEFGDDECKAWAAKINKFIKRYNMYAKFSVIMDKEHRLGYKDSPTDKGKDMFLQLYKERFIAQ